VFATVINSIVQHTTRGRKRPLAAKVFDTLERDKCGKSLCVTKLCVSVTLYVLRFSCGCYSTNTVLHRCVCIVQNVDSSSAEMLVTLEQSEWDEVRQAKRNKVNKSVDLNGQSAAKQANLTGIVTQNHACHCVLYVTVHCMLLCTVCHCALYVTVHCMLLCTVCHCLVYSTV